MADGYGFHHDLGRLIGQTVTIFTTSGGASGCGFTGIVLACTECFIKLLTCPGGAPTYPIQGPCAACCGQGCNTCKSGYGSYGSGSGCGGGCGGGCCGFGYNGYGNYNYLGSVTLIPCDKIASFVQNAVQ
ncbi:hypothetical protein [Vallitalea maricola]|uniref:Uncharacterized protein n=1 Tax=Vallitalea maricola TaxID=3074433 RepID=A0ACB5UK54_9FIRM|nr:hypothetical protein AN2V17_25750 [Vallitalea sp. AN17-2]